MRFQLSEDASNKNSVLSAIFLVAGTCIGGGMLALPVSTGVSGFFPALSMMFLSWFCMTFTALLLLEISLWMEEGVHFITMASRLLGKYGKALSWFLYMFVCYASLVAYTAGGGEQIGDLIEWLFHIPTSKYLGATIFIILFGGALYLGNTFVGRVNSILFIGLLVSYVIFVLGGFREIEFINLTHKKWNVAVFSIPLMLASFSFQTMVPSLVPYLKKNINPLRYSVIGGSTLTLIVYVVWQVVMLGIVPVDGPNGLAEALNKGETITRFFSQHSTGFAVNEVAQSFAFFALITSFLGIGFGLFDFLSDGLKIPRKGTGNVILGILILIPTLFFALFFERIFIIALDASGGYGDSLLNGILPISMVWIGRYYLNYKGEYRVFGGKSLLLGVLLFYIFSLLLTLSVHLNIIQPAGYVTDPLDVKELSLNEASKNL
ncbi:MAG: amino acid transporter [Chlamydia sp. 32-24]|nr:MAG: amino acid transporter [Chlamydia sp. 32-24]